MKKTLVLAAAVATICIGSQAWAGDIHMAGGAMRKNSPENVEGGSGSHPEKFPIAHYYNSAIKRHYRNSSSPAPGALHGGVVARERFPIAHYYNSAIKRHYRNSSSPALNAVKDPGRR